MYILLLFNKDKAGACGFCV